MLVQSLQVPSAFEIFCNDKSRYQDCSDRPKQLFDTAVKIWSDSKVALAQASKPDNWVVDKLRHIRTAYFFFKSYVRSAQLELCSCSGIDNPADIFTKGFGAPGKTAANQKAVAPVESRSSRLVAAPATSNSAATASALPQNDAIESGLAPFESAAVQSAPASTSSFIISTFP